MIEVAHKILLPQRPSYLIDRPRLREIVATVDERQLLLLVAPAGYGKTSLLIEWAHHTNLPVCWYALDRYDRDPHTFVTYMATTMVQRFPAQLPLTAALIRSASSWTIETALATLGRELSALGQPLALVIDDWHLVDEVAPIGEAVSDLLRRAPNLRLILATRTYPSLPDLLLRTAQGRVVGLAEQVLRFTPDEAAAALKQQAAGDIAAVDVATLTAKANGWITAILLMARSPELAAQAWLGPGQGSERRVYEFLTEQVFDRLDPPLQQFLCESALLEELQAGQCDRLLERRDSEAMLDQLLRQHVFVSEIEGGVLRYHPLFREFLLARFRRYEFSRFQQTARRVARGYAGQQQWAPAFDLCIMAGDREAACEVLVQSGHQLFRQGQLATLERCFEVLPLETLPAGLLCLKGRLRLSRSRTQEAAALADMAVAAMQPAETDTVRLFQTSVAVGTGDYREAIRLAELVLAGRPTAAQRGDALRVAANCHGRLGDLERAMELLNEALKLQRQRGDIYSMALLYHDLGICQEQAGRLREAERSYRQAEGYWSTVGNVGARALSRNSTGVVLHMMGQYREAHYQLQAALEDARTAAASTYEAAIAASLGDLYCDLELWVQAETCYQLAESRRGSAFIQGYVEVARIRLLAYQRHFAAANVAIERLEEPVAAQHQAALFLIQARIAIGRRQFSKAQDYVNYIRRSTAADSTEAILAYVMAARIAAEQTPPGRTDLLAGLHSAVEQAHILGRDAFLVAELSRQPGLMRQAAAADWPAAADYTGRIELLRRTARRVSGDGHTPIVRVQALGADCIDIDGEELELGWRQAREVFFYLLSHPRGSNNEDLCAAIWPDRDAKNSRTLLRTAIHRLRSLLPEGLITMQGRRLYRIDRELAQIDYDLEQFFALTEPLNDDPDSVMDGLDLYRGPFLAWSEHQWSQEIRTAAEQRFSQTLQRTAQLYEQRARWSEALALYNRAQHLDPLDEAAAAGLMRCNLALGNRAAAIEIYQRTRRRLFDELGLPLDSTSELEQLYARILAAGD
jgi:LuxR family transcriptional regulator, maltose regulon positive regulatory protein